MSASDPTGPKLLLSTIRDTADQSIRGMEHSTINDPELPEVRLTQDTWVHLAEMTLVLGSRL